MNSALRYLLIILISFILSGIIACKGHKDVTAHSDYKIDMLQLDLGDKMNPQRIEASFPSLGLQYICTIDQLKNLVVFEIDLDKTSLADAIAFLDKEVGVQSAGYTNGCK